MPDGKWIEGLTPEMPVEAAAAAVLSARFAVVRYFLPLAVERGFDDPEYVHQLRVASRRAATALRTFADCLPRKYLRSAKRTLGSIRRAAGDARDWDVFLIRLSESRSLATAVNRPAFDYLAGYAMGERNAAQARLVATAGEVGPRFLREAGELVDRIHSPKDDSTSINFGSLAVRRIGALLAQFNGVIEAKPSAPETLHRARILAKRLRYSLELFAICFPPAFNNAVYPRVEELQELLGVVQDAAIGLDRLIRLRDWIKRTLPRERPRLAKGLDSQIRMLKAMIPSGKKAFATWRRDWLQLTRELKHELATATINA